MSPSDTPDALFERYLSGTASPEERAAVEAWTAGEPSRAHRLHVLEAVCAEQRSLGGNADVNAGWDRLETKIEQQRTNATRRAPSATTVARYETGRGMMGARPQRGLWSMWSSRSSWPSVFAAVLLVFGVALYRTVSVRSTVESQTYRALPGQQRRVQLADGSQVILAPATTIEVRRDSVAVEGQAYFTIVPRPDRPFVVLTANAIVHVLGTRFAVRQYATDANSHVAVEEGRVSLRSLRKSVATDNPTILTARMVGRVTDSSVVIPSGVSVEEYTGWTRGRLIFDETPLREVIAGLARAYGADIRIADSVLAKEPLTITVSVAEKTLPQVLDVIGLATGTRYTRADTVFVLVPARRATRAPQFKRFPQPERQYGQ